MSAAAESLGQAMYVATKDDRLWLLNVQRKLYARSWEGTSYVFEKLWGLVTDIRIFESLSSVSAAIAAHGREA